MGNGIPRARSDAAHRTQDCQRVRALLELDIVSSADLKDAVQRLNSFRLVATEVKVALLTLSIVQYPPGNGVTINPIPGPG